MRTPFRSVARPTSAGATTDQISVRALRSNRSIILCSLLALVGMVVARPAYPAAMFVPLGDLPGGTFGSSASGVSADGSVVVGFAYSASGAEAFRWTSAGGMVGLGGLPLDPSSGATAVSADGSTVVGWGSDGFFQAAFRWTSAGGMVGVGTLGYDSNAQDVSADGSVVVGDSFYDTSPSGSRYEAFRWTSTGGMVGLGVLPCCETDPYSGSGASGVSADGSVVVGWVESYIGEQAFRWTEATGMVGLGDLTGGSFLSLAMDVSADGSVVVGKGTTSSGTEAFRWTSGSGMVGLGQLLGTTTTEAVAVSADGSIVVGRGYATSSSDSRAFIWDAANGMRELDQVLTDLGVDLTGWTLTRAQDISADGKVIVGYGTNPDGQTEAWLAFIPEPGTGLLLMMGLVALALRRATTWGAAANEM